jgi:hypothetical protein
MERVLEALENSNFVWFLENNYTYTNGPTYFENLLHWLDKASLGPVHHTTDYIKRALKLFNHYFSLFSNISPFLLPSYHFFFPPLFPKKECLLGWTYAETIQCNY